MLIKLQLVRQASVIHLDDELASEIKYPMSRRLFVVCKTIMHAQVWQPYYREIRLPDSVAGRENICL